MRTLKLFFTLCLALSFTFAFGQSYGFKAGVNYSLAYGTPEELNGSAIESVSGGVGFQIGALASFDLVGDAIGLQVELLYDIRNSNKMVDIITIQNNPAIPVPVEVTVDSDISNTYSFINIPVLLTFGGEKVSFYAGPNVAFMVSGNSDIATLTNIALPDGTILDDISGQTEQEVNQLEEGECGPCFNSLEIGAQAGIIYNFTPGLGIDLRVGHSLTDFTDNDNDTSILDDTTTREDSDRHFYVQLGVQFKF